MMSQIQWAYALLQTEFGEKEAAIKKYRELARIHHPDYGGDDAKMKELNQAKEIVEASNCAYQPRDWKAANARNLERFKRITADIESLMQNAETEYLEHFMKHFPDVCTANIRAHASVSTGLIHCKWSTPDFTTTFRLTVYVDKDTPSMSLGAGSTEENYSIIWRTEAYHQRRDYRIAQSHYVFNKLSGHIVDPSAAFPPKSLARIASLTRRDSKVMRRDFEAALKNELQGTSAGEWWYLPFNKGRKALALYRYVLLRAGGWALLGVYEKPEGFERYQQHIEGATGFLSMPEDESTLELLKAIMEGLDSGRSLSDICTGRI